MRGYNNEFFRHCFSGIVLGYIYCDTCVYFNENNWSRKEVNVMGKSLYFIRGVSGSGKTTLAHSITDNVFSADYYFYDEYDNYVFDPSKLTEAHKWCRDRVEEALESGASQVAVANTFTQEWEFEPYVELAKANGYTVFHIIVENRHGGKSIHDVPDSVIKKQKDRFDIKL